MAVALIFLIAHSSVAQTAIETPGSLTTLFDFSNFMSGYMDGRAPYGGLVMGDDGNFYGTTSTGGDPTCRCGTFFQIPPGGKLRTIRVFTTPIGFGARAPLVKGRDGNFYGTAWGSGVGSGIAFRMTPEGVYTPFGALPGYAPNGLTLASDGNFYGTSKRHNNGSGAFFRVTPAGVVTSLRVFSISDGITLPNAVVEGRDGNFYGTAQSAIFRITAAGALTVLLRGSPAVGGPDFGGLGAFVSGLVLGSDGDFYGVSANGVFSVTSSGVFSRLVRFSDVGLNINSGDPNNDHRSNLIEGADGSFYGTNLAGNGVSVYRVTGGKFQLIYRIPYFVVGLPIWPEGSTPSILAQGPDGLYGTAFDDGPTTNSFGTVFKITCPGCGGSPLPLPPPGGGTAKPADYKIEVIDPNNDDLRPLFSGAVKWDLQAYDIYATYPRLTSGLAADGVTHLAVRWRVPQAGEVAFTITDETKNTAVQVGSLGCIYSAACAPFTLTTYTVPAEQISDGYMAFALLRAPMDFARPGVPGDNGEPLRTIHVTATQVASNVTTSQAIILTRPPVVLLHGLWSEKATWDWPIKCPPTVNPLPGCIVSDPLFIVWAQDYENQNADRFEVNLGFVPVKGINQPREGVRIALDQLRAKQIAATQVDFFGHSMGGLLGRLYAGGYKGIEYYRDDNLHAGDIHKLITLDTPHYGSELAPQLLDPTAKEKSELGASLEPLLGCMTCGAVADLSPGSEPLSNMPLAAVPSHAIVGVGGIQTLADLKTVNTWMPPSLLKVLTSPVNTVVQWTGVCSFGALNHDLIVSAPSQIGGITGDAVTFFQADASFGNPWWWAIHFSVTKESRIARRAVELLNAPVASPVFAQFPAITAPRQGVGGSCL